MEDMPTKDLFHTQTLDYTEMDLIYGHQKNDAPNIYMFGILTLCDIRNLNCTIE